VQPGFSPAKGTTDATFVVRMMEQKHGRRKKLYCALRGSKKLQSTQGGSEEGRCGVIGESIYF